MSGLRVVYRPLDQLIPYARNSRTHNDAQIAQIAASIREFGWTNPVLIDEEGGIIAGHGRVLAARQLKHENIPTITLTGLSEAQKRAYVIADNKLALNAGWDEALLKLEIEDLKLLDFNVDLLGFNDAEMTKVLFGSGENQVEEHWEGMPEFDQPDAEGFRSLIVHFETEEGFNQFLKTLGLTVTPVTKFVWYPPVVRESVKDKRYASES